MNNQEVDIKCEIFDYIPSDKREISEKFRTELRNIVDEFRKYAAMKDEPYISAAKEYDNIIGRNM